MLDFTRALYLGMCHPWAALRPWNSLTIGVPGALDSRVEVAQVARDLAGLMGLERGVLGRSTLHLFLDLFDLMSRRNVSVFVDSGVYPIARWAAKSAARTVPVATFRHLDADDLACRMKSNRSHAPRAIVITDGWCPRCGKSAPVRQYLDLVGKCGGWVVLDDTQALGILGRRNGEATPYGRGGGGLARWLGISKPGLIIVASLAKGFGVPTAILASGRAVVDDFEVHSRARVHSSPPSTADLRGAERALAINKSVGDELRKCLLQRVRFFRRRLRHVGLGAKGSLFPVQSLSVSKGLDLYVLHRRLTDHGVKALLLRRDPPHQMEIVFIINALQSFREIDRAVSILTRCLRCSFTTKRKLGRGMITL